ncbi:tRNA 2-thiouridine(34) synthase MnmA [Candidatus Curculioniphilus buchneri]|uniref:tRNA 2-thiouridine(34) synthase MnmA n=1 Tax=Candidatus Curculioniphilus buchneri TaxID=690594 RepID=UPI00376F2722
MSNKFKKKVVVGMSGGVDSSVSAWLLQQQNYHVEGLFIQSWNEDLHKGHCTSEKDLIDTLTVCDQLNIVLHIVNFSNEYWNNVFQNFLSEYQKGRTPNPDILCNKEIKFKAFLKFATDTLEADYIATGHYIRRLDVNGKSQLIRGIDSNKDQSYFLYTLSHCQIARCLFPVGALSKLRVRHIAAELALVTANKKDSTGICFIGKRKFCDFISCYLPKKLGEIISVNGEKIGHHQGLMCYTIGQRKGLGIGGMRHSSNAPWYVVDKDLMNNRLIVAQGYAHPSLMSTSLIAENLHWVNREKLIKPLRCTVKTRYRQQDICCLAMPQLNGSLRVTFNQPVAAITPGQSVVFYLSERCLGGGIIKSRQLLADYKYESTNKNCVTTS